ncbi:MAG: histidine phosphatase family protein [Candidatus Dormibacteraeota bacterium]|nr:histidine phosphatase family protein [Candidatus Dormibacteraeota bacterium]
MTERHTAFLNMLDQLHQRHLVGVDGVREVWLIRHADAYSGLDQLQEGLQDPPLSQVGRQQAKLLAARLKLVRLDAVWASDLARAGQTARPAAEAHGLQVRVEPLLREVRTWWDEGRIDAVGEPGVYPFPEPEADVAARMSEAIAKVLHALEAGSGTPRAAVFSHNAAITIYLSRLLGLTWGQLGLMPHFTSVSVVAFLGDRAVVRSIADATHLSAAQMPD